MKANFLVLSALVITVFWIASPGLANTYFSEDFESYKAGDDITEKSDLWEMTEENPISGGIASTEQSLSGSVSALFEGMHNMGFSFQELDLPETYVVSCWFFHDAEQSPPPEAVVTLADVFPVTGNWFGVGTKSEAVKEEDYTYRDKKGTGTYEDTGIPRRTDWVNFVFLVEPGETKLLIDEKEIYKAEVGSEYFVGFLLSRGWAGAGGSVFLDDVCIADTVEEIPKWAAVKTLNKLSVTWGTLKRFLH